MKTAQKPDVIVHGLSVCEVLRDTLTESGSEAGCKSAGSD